MPQKQLQKQREKPDISLPFLQSQIKQPAKRARIENEEVCNAVMRSIPGMTNTTPKDNETWQPLGLVLGSLTPASTTRQWSTPSPEDSPQRGPPKKVKREYEDDDERELNPSLSPSIPGSLTKPRTAVPPSPPSDRVNPVVKILTTNERRVLSTIVNAPVVRRFGPSDDLTGLLDAAASSTWVEDVRDYLSDIAMQLQGVAARAEVANGKPYLPDENIDIIVQVEKMAIRVREIAVGVLERAREDGRGLER